jgi:DNA invertase Pin-like site-specific DNA recombinase
MVASCARVIGYARVSTDGQTLDAPNAALIAAGAERVFAEKVSGAVSDLGPLRRLSLHWTLATCCW